MTKDLKVLIVGGGIAGLTLAALLERAGIDYAVYERASVVRPLGSALAIGPNVLPVIEQLGLLQEFISLSMVTGIVSNFNAQLQPIGYYDYRELKERTGYHNYIISRPRLYTLLYSQIPREKVHMNKKLTTFTQDEQGVTLTFTDGTTSHGDIVVGADGAYSQVRQSLYTQLTKQGQLPPSDLEELPCTSICLVGQTGPLDVTQYPYLRQQDCRFENVNGPDMHTYLTWTMPDDSICWTVIHHLQSEASKRTLFLHNEEWGPGSTEAMIERVRDYPIPSGENRTLGDLIDATPRDLISQVALEGKFFETWYGGRAVLIGDACHKMYPSTAQGANTAIQDAIILSNHLYALKDTSLNGLTAAFEGYFKERVDNARAAYETSDRFRQLFRMRRVSTIVRFFVTYAPQWLWRIVFDKLYSYRPQVNFLPRIPDRGTVKALPQSQVT
ncbi:hypothetical protein BGZ94_002791 [Podila epigama]|nr:hypothetical protein BGZ94_002791 [Podila epigama]